jgi:hypothetical protein
MDQYALIDHAALVRNLNVVCRELGQVMDTCGLYCGPPALTHENVQEDIPSTLHNIAIAAGWIDRSVELGDEEFDSGRADLLGNVIVDADYMEWFLGLVSKTLYDLEEQAAANKAAQDRDYERMLKLLANGSQPPQMKADADIWNRPNPAEIVKRFRIASKLTNERIAEATEISLKTLERLITRDRLGMRMANAKKLLTFMKHWFKLHANTNAISAEEVAFFTNLTEVELYWRKKKQS